MKLNLSDAPTFRPSPEEFKDPFAYISAIRDQAESYGICKVGTTKPSSTDSGIPPAIACALASRARAQRHLEAYLEHTESSGAIERPSTSGASALGLAMYGFEQVVPPAGWQPPFAIDSQNFRFRTRIQAVNELQHTVDQAAAAESFNRDYHAWLRSQGKPVKRPPQLAGEELDLAKLHRIVLRRGGYDRVCEDRLWKDVARIMQVSCPSQGQSHLAGQSQTSRNAKILFESTKQALASPSRPV